MNTWRVMQADVRKGLARLPTGSARCCITSPPYWGLRDYGTAIWDGGGPPCDHQSGRFTRGGLSGKQASNRGSNGDEARRECGKCGARRIDHQIGLEETPEAYVAALVEVFREVRRVLTDDGTLWLNLGDSYARTGGWASNDGLDGCKRGESGRAKTNIQEGRNGQKRPVGLKEKDLVGIPWRVAFALQADGWYLRQDIIWHKPNPMSESVTDRCTKAHEYIFLMTKSPRYFYDAEAVKEPMAESSIPRLMQNIEGQVGTARANGGAKTNGNFKASGDLENCTRNKRSVWTVTTKPFKDAHFATFPEDLIEPCILAGSALGDTVLDPFAGSGTTGAVAIRHQRNFVGTELNPDYVRLARMRIGAVAPLFAEEVA